MYKKSTYNPDIHNRRSIRLKGYDYAQAGLYFITICCQDRICRFGHIENATMILNEFGTVAYNEWIKLSERFPNIQLDVFQIMPNHMHGIIEINVRAGFTPAPNNLDIGASARYWASARVAPTIGDMVGAYKSLVANGCLDIYKSKNETMGKFWQRNYYEHIIRNEKSYHNISEYIMTNPEKWQDDKFYRL